MMSGAVQGALLHWLVRMSGAKRVLEVGTFTGYAAICMATALPADGHLDTIEGNLELEYLIRKHISGAALNQTIDLHMGNALELLSKLDGPFDFVFLDANKLEYPQYYDAIIDRMNPGGLIVADNVLWAGKVIHEKMDADTRALHLFNQKIHADERVENLLLPLRDGLMMVRVK